MQFARLFAVAATAIATVNAAVQFTNSAFNDVTVGKTFTLTWSGATGPVEILLKNGPSTALVTVSTVASGQTGTSFTYTVPANLPVDTYAFSITDGTTTNYSPQFQPLGATASATSSGVSSTASGSSTASSASSASSVSSVSSSISSRISSLSTSLISSITANTTSASSTASVTGVSNSTTTGGSSTGSATKTGSSSASKTSGTATGSSTSTGTTVPNTNAASEFASPLALVFLTVAAIISLN